MNNIILKIIIGVLILSFFSGVFIKNEKDIEEAVEIIDIEHSIKRSLWKNEISSEELISINENFSKVKDIDFYYKLENYDLNEDAFYNKATKKSNVEDEYKNIIEINNNNSMDDLYNKITEEKYFEKEYYSIIDKNNSY